MNFLERLLSNYFLAWQQIFNYTDKTTRIPFWHFYFVDGFIGALLYLSSSSSLITDPNDVYPISSGFGYGYLYSIPSFLTFISLVVRRLRDIGKENLFIWTLVAFIPIYNLFLFSQPSSNKSIS
tara:strand:+ start:453 stop:824 length:372 start_codon:yes stop_codon:yes gene_type:complete